MRASELAGRVKVRYLDDEAVPSDDKIIEAVQTVHDRLAIRLDVEEVPEKGASIVVAAAIKSLRLMGYEGSTSESAGDGGSVSNSFVADVLAEFEPEIDALRKSLHGRGVRFL